MSFEIDRWKPYALSELRPNALWAVDDNVVIWQDTEQSEPTAQELLDKCTEMETAWQLAELRKERDRLLLETDYWVLGDTATATQAQLDYRQALRDITDTYSSINTVVWPTKP